MQFPGWRCLCPPSPSICSCEYCIKLVKHYCGATAFRNSANRYIKSKNGIAAIPIALNAISITHPRRAQTNANAHLTVKMAFHGVAMSYLSDRRQWSAENAAPGGALLLVMIYKCHFWRLSSRQSIEEVFLSFRSELCLSLL